MIRPAVYLTVLYLLTLIACTQPAHTASVVEKKNIEKDFDKESAAIQHVMYDQANAWNKGSIDSFMMGYWHSDSLQFITKNGIRKGYDSISNNYKKYYNSPDKLGVLTFSKLVISPLSDDKTAAHVTGNWEVKQKDKVLSGFFSLVFRKIHSEWKIVIDHTW
jgi:ketosteroid isomerase-like protein